MNTDEILAKMRQLRTTMKVVKRIEHAYFTDEQWAQILAEFCVLWDYLDNGLKNGARLPKDWHPSMEHALIVGHVPTKKIDPTKTRCTTCRHTKNLCTCGR